MNTKKLYDTPSIKVIEIEQGEILLVQSNTPEQVNLEFDFENIEDEGYAE